MKWTNKHNLPQTLVSAIKNDTYDKTGDISATGLISSPRRRTLEVRHDDKISVDVSENIYALQGQGVHAVLERSDTTNHLSEERLTARVLGWTVSGKIDLLCPNGILTDYKVTSVFSFLLGDKPEWEQQLNIYRWLLHKNGMGDFVKGLQIVAILRDWMSSKVGEDGYPSCAVMVVDIPLWDIKTVERFVDERVMLHQEAATLGDKELPPCSAREMWRREDSWAAKKPANKRATRVFKSEPEAKEYASANGLIVEYRRGESVRCARFCRAAAFCNQWGKLKNEQPGE